MIRILTAVFFGISLYLGYYLYGGIQDTIETRKSIRVKEAAVIKKLELIRFSERLFEGFYGRYTSNWDSLIQFVKNGQIPVIERREEIIQQAYGQEQIIIHTDTLGFASVWDQVFEKKFTMNATEDGIFMGFKVKVGDRVIKNQRAYSLKIGDKTSNPPFSEEGVVSKLADIKPGTPVKKGTFLIGFWDNRFDPTLDLTRLPYKPGTDTKFNIYAGVVDKGGLMVDVIEVVDPQPDNPARSESSDIHSRKPLRFGSRVDVSTAGNWE